MHTIAVTGPSHWAPYLINGDASGLEPEEAAAVDAFVERIGGDCVDARAAGFCWRHDAWRESPFGADCQEYFFLVEE